MLKALVCGEGPSDVGNEDYSNQQWVNGPAIAFILNASAVKLDIHGIRYAQLKKNLKIQKFKTKGHATKAERLAKYAALKRIPIAICYIDCDKNDFEKLYAQIEDGFKASGTHVIGIPMLPKAMIESWLLSDEGSYKKVFGCKPQNPMLPAKPETIWGAKQDPSSNYPKNYLNRVLNQYDKLDDSILFLLAQTSKQSILCRKCPLSYGRFYADMQRISG